MQNARSLARAAELRGLPAQVLRAEWPLAEVQPLAGGLIGRDELGGVWRFDLAGKPGVEILPAGSATQLVVARDAPVWAVIAGAAVQVFGGEQARTIELGDAIYSGWRLGSDGRTLVALKP